MRTTTLVIAAILLATFGLGSTWVMFGRHGPPATPQQAEQMVRAARSAAADTARSYVADHPIPAAKAGQTNTERLAELDAWFDAYEQTRGDETGGEPTARDAARVAEVQARAGTLHTLSEAYRPIADDKDPVVCARARLSLAEIHLAIAKSIESLPAPAYLTPEQQASFLTESGNRAAAQELRARIELEVAQGLEERIPESSDVHAQIRAVERALGDA